MPGFLLLHVVSADCVEQSCAPLRDFTRKTRYSQRINQATSQEKTKIHRRTKNRKSQVKNSHIK
jgi:hypothetical protein